MRYALHHEINDGLRGIDDAVCVRDIRRESLKEFLIKRVEEMLFLGEVLAEHRGLLNGDIEPIQGFQKLLTTERLSDEGIHDVFNFACNDVSTGEVRVIKDGTEDTLGEDMLDEHLLDGIL